MRAFIALAAALLALPGPGHAEDRTTFAVSAVAPGGPIMALGDGSLYYLRRGTAGIRVKIGHTIPRIFLVTNQERPPTR